MKEFSEAFLEIQPYDKDKDLLQCLECGKWFKHLGNLHLRVHHITPTEYKKKYGINKWQTLCSYATQKKISIIGIEFGRDNLIPAIKGGKGLLYGKKNPRSEQALITKRPQMVEMAHKVKERWKAGKYDYLREQRSESRKKEWMRLSIEARRERTAHGRLAYKLKKEGHFGG